jgi:chitinase
LRYPNREDIQTCQSLNKTILLSLGGATYTEGGFASADEATTWAAKIWAMFGPPGPAPASPDDSDPCACSDSDPVSSEEALRPFGLASVDGFDMDFEASSANMAPFAGALRRHMDAATAATGRRFLLSAAPQCPFPDVAMREMLEQVGFDFVSVQFYNNYCGAGSYPGNFNFDRWDRWAREESVNKGVKVLLGLPGSPTAAGSGYVSGGQLEAVVQHSKGFGSFGGIMVW